MNHEVDQTENSDPNANPADDNTRGESDGSNGLSVSRRAQANEFYIKGDKLVQYARLDCSFSVTKQFTWCAPQAVLIQIVEDNVW
jgi:hypothetical protein